ncbi:hypothetical protein JL722_2974 [Aureococcus anophagefferens]|nr:hypothetical protein JL722_2974 [Aureococcus anophagefferens]
MGRVQRDGGIAALSEAERNAYVDDVGAFVRYAKLNPGFDVYAKRVIERRYRAAGYANISGAPAYADFFAGSLSASLRLALAADQKVTRPLANYVWFSESPKPALISHMMNPIDGNFKIDLGLSLPSL